MQKPYKLWATPNSLFSAKVRSYLLKKGLPFEEIISSDPSFVSILREVGHIVVPVVQTPDGKIIQDSTEIVEVIEGQVSEPSFQPKGDLLGFVARVLDAFALCELMPVAMHYRWSFREQQELFIASDFAKAVPWLPYKERLQAASSYMDKFAGFLPNLGVTPATIPSLEDAYHEILAALEAHFQVYPYFLGGRPCVADFGMMGPMFAHLARDPIPSMLMKTKAPSVFRWTERMNNPQICDTDYRDSGVAYFRNDDIPAAMIAILKLVFSQWTPGFAADVLCFNSWLAGLDEPNTNPH
jgi:glutathione S-transferase